MSKGEVTVDLSISCRNERATCRNVEAVVGPDTESEILVTGHVDSHDIGDGARDNGAGSVLAAEIGRLLALNEDRLDTKVRLISFGGEEPGLYGSYYWQENHDLDAVKCQVNMDGIGYSRDLMVNGSESVREVFEESARRLGVPIETNPLSSVGPFTDQWPFIKEGVASVTCRSREDSAPVRYGNTEWAHTHADTLDKLDWRDMRDLGIQIATAVAGLADAETEIPSVPVSAVRDAVPEPVHEYLRLAGRSEWE
ncbi:M28 family metallopeptidase [Haloplanus sp. GCM10025708]|uniref:M28 family metallopeptidase n=1 Tax=Haloplanus sp. GCM10025708 TaxID=3252679 RepID=UPI003611C53B